MGDGSPLYKEKAQVIESMGLIPYTDDNGNGLEIFSGHTVYLRRTRNTWSRKRLPFLTMKPRKVRL